MSGSSYHCRCHQRQCSLGNDLICPRDPVKLTIVIPTFNEADNIGRLAERLLELVITRPCAVVVVDDGSSDGTPEVINSLIDRSDSVVLLSRLNKRGIFSAIQDGIQLLPSEYIAFMDADYSHPPEMVPRLVKEAATYDIVSASRYMKGGGIKAPVKRVIASRGLNGICRFFLRLAATDVLGGFHAMRRTVYNELEFKYPALWGEFDLELFYRAKKLRFSLKELPFIYFFRDFGVSKSVDMKYGIAYLRQVLRLLIRG